MRELLNIDLYDYDENWVVHKRTAAKAVIFVDGKLVMQQTIFGDVKFIGGGVESGESLIDCLIREVREESGYNVIVDSIREIGIVIERRKDKFEDCIFEMTAYMFSCDVDTTNRGDMCLTENEKKYVMNYVLVTPGQAISINEEVSTRSDYKAWLYRDTGLLKLLFGEATGCSDT